MQINIRTMFAIVSALAVNIAAAKVHLDLPFLSLPVLVALDYFGFRFARPTLWILVVTFFALPTIVELTRALS